jgi:hypothetical protein
VAWWHAGQVPRPANCEAAAPSLIIRFTGTKATREGREVEMPKTRCLVFFFFFSGPVEILDLSFSFVFFIKFGVADHISSP